MYLLAQLFIHSSTVCGAYKIIDGNAQTRNFFFKWQKESDPGVGWGGECKNIEHVRSEELKERHATLTWTNVRAESEPTTRQDRSRWRPALLNQTPVMNPILGLSGP